MTYVDPFPTTLPSSTDPANFDERADAYYGHLPTFVDQMNDLPPIVAAAAGTSLIPFKFKTATSGDPGSGGVLLNNATQTSATAANLDLLDALGNDVTGRLARYGAGTSDVKGELVFTKVGDGRVWLSFEVTSGTSPGGYRGLVLQNGVGSSSSPFSANDDVAVSYVPAGEKGDTGINLPWQSTPAAVTISGSPTTITFGALSTSFTNVTFDFDTVTLSASDLIYLAFSTNNASSFSSPVQIVNASAATSWTMLVELYDYLATNGWCRGTIGNTVQSQRRSGGAVTHVRFSANGKTFTGGVITPRSA